MVSKGRFWSDLYRREEKKEAQKHHCPQAERWFCRHLLRLHPVELLHSQMLSLPPWCPPQPAPATPWDQPCYPWAPAPSVTPAQATAPASPAWRGPAATTAFPATGASVPTAAAPATAPAAVTPAPVTAAAAGELGGPGHPFFSLSNPPMISIPGKAVLRPSLCMSCSLKNIHYIKYLGFGMVRNWG